MNDISALEVIGSACKGSLNSIPKVVVIGLNRPPPFRLKEFSFCDESFDVIHFDKTYQIQDT